jgi:hypothetical protein
MVGVFDEHMGRVRPVYDELGYTLTGAWNQVIGEAMPAHLYVLEWESYKQREEVAARFYSDARWPALRAQLLEEAGGEAVRSHAVSFYEPAKYWTGKS